MGTLIIFETTAGAFGGFLMGLGYDRTGSYGLLFLAYIGIILAAAISLVPLRFPRAEALQ